MTIGSLKPTTKETTMQQANTVTSHTTSQATPRYQLCTQLFDGEDGQISSLVKNKSNGQVIELLAKTLFYNRNWLRSFSDNDMRRIAFAVTESNVALEKHAMREINNQKNLVAMGGLEPPTSAL